MRGREEKRKKKVGWTSAVAASGALSRAVGVQVYVVGFFLMCELCTVPPPISRQVRFAEHGGQLKEAIVAAASDVAAFPGMQEGVYLVGTGSTGLAPTFATLGVGYFTGL